MDNKPMDNKPMDNKPMDNKPMDNKTMDNKTKVNLLINKGVKIPMPELVFIAEDVELSRISGDNVIFYPGTKIMGKETLIMRDTTLGLEGPVTLDNVLVGAGTCLNGGFFQKCAFAGQNNFGSGAHVRGGTILEEGASGAHAVGLKQSILFPFVTLGSLINFCDCLMAGGTSRKDHSEVGSSFIHFNYTPNQDKATPSMFGNVYQGVMLKSRPIFLGGQGGVVGPCRLPFGSVTAAGTIWRKDVIEPDRLMFGGGMREFILARNEGVYSNVKRIFKNNCLYIAELIGLMNWYFHIRDMFISDFFSKQLLLGMMQILLSAIDERINRLDDFVQRLFISKELISAQNRSKNNGKITPPSAIPEAIIAIPALEEHDAVINEWQFVRIILENAKQVSISKKLPPEPFVLAIENGISEHGRDYIRVIQTLDSSIADLGSKWLASIENSIIR